MKILENEVVRDMTESEIKEYQAFLDRVKGYEELKESENEVI